MGDIVYKKDQEQENEDRLQRAKSWYRQSRKVTNGSDEQFLFLWIAFEAAYGSELDSKYESDTSKSTRFRKFIDNILVRDKKDVIEKHIKREFTPMLRLLENKYTFEPFWKHIRGEKDAANWETRLKNYRTRTITNWQKGKTKPIFCEALMRLSTLRNQMMHGSKTYGDASWGKSQLHSGCIIMKPLVGLIIKVMEADIDKNPDTAIWGPIFYPRIEDSAQAR